MNIVYTNENMDKPFSQACENNKKAILSILHTAFADAGSILEIGSGTGQHAVYFAENLPHLYWQPTEQAQYLAGCKQWVEEARLSNLGEPMELDVLQQSWPFTTCEGAFSANTAHIMAWSTVCAMMSGIARLLFSEGHFCLYGPFQYGGHHTSASNARFDAQLQQQNAAMGIRDRYELERVAKKQGMILEADYAMPANNRTLVWRRL